MLASAKITARERLKEMLEADRALGMEKFEAQQAAMAPVAVEDEEEVVEGE